MKICAVNIGNTNTQFAVCSEGKLEQVNCYPTKDLCLELLPQNMPFAVASVVEEKNKIFKDCDAFFITPNMPNELDTSIVDNSTIGADRLANAITLAHFAQLPAINIDCGTAITFEVVDTNKLFRGGAILPGRTMLRKALNHYTDKLPLAQRCEEKKPPVLGRNTLDAIISGCDIGILGAIKEIIQKIQIELGVDTCQVIASGGDADFFADNILEVNYGGKDFTLRGIVAAWKYANNHIDNTEKEV